MSSPAKNLNMSTSVQLKGRPLNEPQERQKADTSCHSHTVDNCSNCCSLRSRDLIPSILVSLSRSRTRPKPPRSQTMTFNYSHPRKEKSPTQPC
ncbi:UNVERIFIED_CONTAM: hypothetical protein Sradi_0906500 [Sesamum radiatum]|uniref:Uncharacterized protein n=1 Tax=Sesamum radiatum TaxID=300843 RepID=A0AAW2V318_SESRA